MALSYTNLVSAASGGNYGTSSYSSGSFTPPNNSLIVALVGGQAWPGSVPSAASPFTCTGGSLTWTRRLIATTASNGWPSQLELWTAPVTTGASMTITVDHASATMGGWLIHAIAITGYDTGSPIGASATNNSFTTDGAASLTLSGAPASDSVVIAARLFQMDTAGGSSANPGSGFTEIYDTSVNDWASMESQRRDGSTSTSVPWADVDATGTTIATSVALAIEIKAASTGITGTLGVSDGRDTVAGTATVDITGALSKSDSRDTLSSTSTLGITGALGATDGRDTLASDSTLASDDNSGALAATDSRDTMSASATLDIQALVNAVDPRDTLSSSATLDIEAELSATDHRDTLAGVATLGITGELEQTDGRDTLAGAGNPIIDATLAQADARDTLSATATLQIAGTLAQTDTRDSVSGQTNLGIAGTLAETDRRDTLSSASTLGIEGQLGVTDRRDTVSSYGYDPDYEPPEEEEEDTVYWEPRRHPRRGWR